jgi:hypothetical protein
MAGLSSKVKAYAAANGVANVDFIKDVNLQDDGQGPYIRSWNLSIPKPTNAQLAEVEADANKAEANAQVIAKRKEAYGSLESQIEFISENGLDAWQSKVAQIKAANPKQ